LRTSRPNCSFRQIMGVLRPQPRSRWSYGTKVVRTLCGGTLPVTHARARRALRSAWYQGCRCWACRQHCAASMHRVEKMLGLASAMRGRGGWKRFVHSCVQFLRYSASMLCIPSMYSRPCISTIPAQIGAETGSPDVLIPYLPARWGTKQDSGCPSPSCLRSPNSGPMLRPYLPFPVTAAKLHAWVSTRQSADQRKTMTYRERHLCDILKAFRCHRALEPRCETSKCQDGQDGALFGIHLKLQFSFMFTSRRVYVNMHGIPEAGREGAGIPLCSGLAPHHCVRRSLRML
jgi:hypothetical protein